MEIVSPTRMDLIHQWLNVNKNVTLEEEGDLRVKEEIVILPRMDLIHRWLNVNKNVTLEEELDIVVIEDFATPTLTDNTHQLLIVRKRVVDLIVQMEIVSHHLMDLIHRWLIV